ncbi:MAG: hypothetical protein GY816_00030, partial [Cytophagales bacterium]|nr:hypothetical protein [Cytophagales bacterium]
MDSRQKLLHYWRKTQRQLDAFWQLWHDEYLVSLRERYQTTHPTPRIHETQPPKQDEAVLIKEANMPRGSWKMGRINTLIKGHDSKIRAAEVALPNGTKLVRPINQLYPLEVLSSFAKTLVTLLICLTFFRASTGNQCLNIGQNNSYRVISSQTCVSKGIVVLQRIGDPLLCWSEITCPKGHLNEKGKCGPKCSCPTWAIQCSHYKGKLPSPPENSEQILTEGLPDVCSFGPDPRCSSVPKPVHFSQIELYNGSTFFVKHLDIKWQEATPEEYDCVGNGRQSGTPSFCMKHKCLKRSTKICFYRKNEIAYYSNVLGEIPVKAFGTVKTTIYGPKDIFPQAQRCDDCNLHCIKGGIEVSLPEGISFMEVCSAPFCYKIGFPKEQETILFPPEVNLVEHDVTAKIWVNGYLVKNFGITCPPFPYCEMITCYLCEARFANPQCSSNIALLFLFIAL